MQRPIGPLYRIALGLCTAGAALLAAAQQSPVPASYTVGATASGIPFTFLDLKTNRIQGMMVDTVQAVARAGSFGVAVQQTVFSALIPSLTAHKIDIISAALLKTPARQQVVDFSDPVYSYGESLIVRADEASAYASLDALGGEIVGAQVGTVYLDMLHKKGIFKEVRSYDSVADMARDLALGRIRAGLADQPVIAYQIRQNSLPGVKLAAGYQASSMGDVCLVVRKGDAATLARLNRAIATIKADGTLAQIIRKWGI
ncbi:amino acid ABC transporter substrate-binding protein [Verminephrobacter aporrectodeae subsp. tuberculatae]|uniref:Amino acid ABC transporter substrate-binding protein n=1 Tax=Verminephrobacter aporrectodeae subsp. tuberculatae TaxID=1110392 RepID=A0ABT3KYI5_9BURK|nr:ABC transporter substrate-binding protein [Verminephrobacter aporrectodeae]MCW5323032.1 amino acid ABC transporter substrate-binding protein [Verminephrobacter aporrectodeae subsp. tuberculatae]